MQDTSENGRSLARMDERTLQLVRDVGEIKAMLVAHYVTKAEFSPVQKLVYGLVGIVLMAVVGALVALVLVKP